MNLIMKLMMIKLNVEIYVENNLFQLHCYRPGVGTIIVEYVDGQHDQLLFFPTMILTIIQRHNIELVDLILESMPTKHQLLNLQLRMILLYCLDLPNKQLTIDTMPLIL